MTDAHTCPAPNCPVRVPYHHLACKRHWAQLPKPICDQVSTAARRYGIGSEEQINAVITAIEWLEDNTR